MGIEFRTLQFDNVLRYETRQKEEDWLKPFSKMEDFILTQGIYKNGPIFFSVTSNQEDSATDHFIYYLPINGPVQLLEETDFSYQDSFRLEKALFLRQTDGEMDVTVASNKLKSYADSNEIELGNSYYFVLHEVYDDYIIDLFWPTKELGDKE